jgi:hypothetical protein
MTTTTTCNMFTIASNKRNLTHLEFDHMTISFTDIKRKRQIEGVREQGAEKNMKT